MQAYSGVGLETGTPFSGSINIQLSRVFREHTWPHPQSNLSKPVPSPHSPLRWAFMSDRSAEEQGPWQTTESL